MSAAPQDRKAPASHAPAAHAPTKAEQRFEEVQQKRVRTRPTFHADPQLRERIKNDAHVSHKERVDSFNNFLEGLTDHNDLPKVGPG